MHLNLEIIHIINPSNTAINTKKIVAIDYIERYLNDKHVLRIGYEEGN